MHAKSSPTAMLCITAENVSVNSSPFFSSSSGISNSNWTKDFISHDRPSPRSSHKNFIDHICLFISSDFLAVFNKVQWFSRSFEFFLLFFFTKRVFLLENCNFFSFTKISAYFHLFQRTDKILILKQNKKKKRFTRSRYSLLEKK